MDEQCQQLRGEQQACLAAAMAELRQEIFAVRSESANAAGEAAQAAAQMAASAGAGNTRASDQLMQQLVDQSVRAGFDKELMVMRRDMMGEVKRSAQEVAQDVAREVAQSIATSARPASPTQQRQAPGPVMDTISQDEMRASVEKLT